MNNPTSLAEGRYLLVEQLGEGGMAAVYRAFDQRLQVWRAVKILSPDYADKKKIAKRFEAEAQTMALLEHRNIVRVYDVGRDGNIAYIVMELVEGGCLVDWLEHHGPMPPRLALDAIVEVCDGLAAAHDKGVIHRDIKPHNVMITRDGVCRVTDFGIARVGDSETSLTKTGSVMGTWGYMAPEQRTNAKGVDVRADVYATGATLYSLLTDRMPMDLFAADRDSSILEGVHELLVPILVKSTDYDREKRHASVRDLKDELLGIRAQLPELAPETPKLAIDNPGAPPVPDPTQYRPVTEVGHVRAGTHATILPSETHTAGTDPAPTILPDGEVGQAGASAPAGRAHAMTMPPEEVAVTQPGAITRQNRPVFDPNASQGPPSGALSAPIDRPDTDLDFDLDRSAAAAGPSTTSAMMFGASAAMILVTVLLIGLAYTVLKPPDPQPPQPVPVPAVPSPVPDPVPAPTPDPVPQPVGPTPVPVPVPVPVQVPVPVPTPVVPAPTPDPVPVPVPTPPPAAKKCVQPDEVGKSSAGNKVNFKFSPCSAADTAPEWVVTLHFREGTSGPFASKNLKFLSGRWQYSHPNVVQMDYYLDGWGGSIGSESNPKAFVP